MLFYLRWEKKIFQCTQNNNYNVIFFIHVSLWKIEKISYKFMYFKIIKCLYWVKMCKIIYIFVNISSFFLLNDVNLSKIHPKHFVFGSDLGCALVKNWPDLSPFRNIAIIHDILRLNTWMAHFAFWLQESIKRRAKNVHTDDPLKDEINVNIYMCM